MESYKISQLPQAESITEDDLLEVSVSSDSTYDSAKATVGQIAIATMTEFSYDNLSTEDKTIIGAINELIGSGPSVVVEPLSVTENGTYTAEEGKAYSPVTVNIKSDIEKVVSESEWWDDSYLVPITVDGNPVTLNSLLAQNAVSTLLSYSPNQTGTGTPSPQNIRPIEGWTEADLFGCGKNLCNPIEIVHASVRTAGNGGGLGNENEAYRTVIVDYLPKGTYTFSFDMENPYIIRVQVGGTKQGIGDGYILEGIPHNTSRITITTEQSGLFMLAFRNTDTSVITEEPNCLLELGDKVTAYEPYKQGANITESLGGTYYGFTVDLTTGELTIDTMYLSYKWSEFGTKASLGNYTRGQIVLPYEAVYPPTAGKPQMCNVAPYKASFNEDSLHFYCNTDRFSVFLPNDTDGDTVVTAIYELAEPQTVSLTPQAVTLLKGYNMIWTDGNNISLTYRGEPVTTPLLGNTVLTQNNVEESEPTEESLTEVEENVSE